MRCWGWFRLTPKGQSKAQCEALLRKAGVAGEDAPIFCDGVIPERIRTVDEEAFPELQRVLLTIRDGDRLVVPSLGHFVNVRVWMFVAAALARKNCEVVDARTGKIYQVTDPAQGYEAAHQVEAGAAKMRTRKALETRAERGTFGRPAAVGKRKLEELRKAWADPALTTRQICADLKISEATARRYMDKIGRAEAIALHRQGLWLKKA